MSESEQPRSRWRWPPARVFGVGFVIGLVITVPAVFFALLSPVGEALLRFLTPGSFLLSPFGQLTATWPGLLNVALIAAANGLVYGLVALAVVWLLGVVRR